MQVNIGIIGTGTVGSGTIEIIQAKLSEYKNFLNIDLNISMVCAKSEDELKEWKTQGLNTTTNVDELLESPNVDIVVELAGGYDFPKKWLTKAFENGKHAVTANKALIAKYGPELFPIAEANNCQFLFEAAIGGGIPIVRTLQESMHGNQIKSLSCIINGTCNYILTEMRQKGLPFDVVLKDAQEKGYAEADPTFDVDGIDSAHKLSILASICSKSFVDFEKIHISGIRNISLDDIKTVDDLDCTIKLLGIMNISNDGVDARVHPCIIPKDHLLSGVEGVLNAVYLETDNLGSHLQTGAGAGKLPTASAVVADIVSIATKITYGGKSMPMNYFNRGNQAKLVPMQDLKTSYYMRFSTKDQKGILAAITGILSKNDISIRSMVQKNINDPGHVTIGIISEKSQEKNIITALEEIDALDGVVQKSQMIRFAS